MKNSISILSTWYNTKLLAWRRTAKTKTEQVWVLTLASSTLILAKS
jgi:hypothetical protein